MMPFSPCFASKVPHKLGAILWRKWPLDTGMPVPGCSGLFCLVKRCRMLSQYVAWGSPQTRQVAVKRGSLMFVLLPMESKFK